MKKNFRVFLLVILCVILLGARFGGLVDTVHLNIGTLAILRATLGDNADRDQAWQMAQVWLAPEQEGECGFNVPILYMLGNGYFWLGDNTKAIRTQSALVDTGCLKPGDPRLITAYARLAELYLAGNERAKATTNLELALANLSGGERGKFVSQIAVLLGKELETQGETDLAAQSYELAVELDSNNHEPFHRLMDLAVRQKDYPAVLYWSERLEALDPTDPWRPFFLGQMYLQQGAYHPAMENFRQSIALNPSSEQAHFWLGVTFASLEDWEQATQEIQMALIQNPDLPYYHTLLNEYDFKLQKERDATK